MAVILDSGIQKEIDQLEAVKNFSLADAFRSANKVSLESLAFMAVVPPEYQALVSSTTTSSALKREQEAEAKDEEQDQKDRDQRTAHQEQIDENMLRLEIDGEDIQISQGDLRKVMTQRVKELEEEKRELQRNGSDPKRVRQIDNLIDEYRPEIDDLKNHAGDASTASTAEDLMRRDPQLLQETKAMQQAATASPSASATTPQPSASTQADPTPSSSSSSPTVQSVKNNASALGF